MARSGRNPKPLVYSRGAERPGSTARLSHAAWPTVPMLAPVPNTPRSLEPRQCQCGRRSAARRNSDPPWIHHAFAGGVHQARQSLVAELRRPHAQGGAAGALELEAWPTFAAREFRVRADIPRPAARIGAEAEAGTQRPKVCAKQALSSAFVQEADPSAQPSVCAARAGMALQCTHVACARPDGTTTQRHRPRFFCRQLTPPPLFLGEDPFAGVLGRAGGFTRATRIARGGKDSE